MLGFKVPTVVEGILRLNKHFFNRVELKKVLLQANIHNNKSNKKKYTPWPIRYVNQFLFPSTKLFFFH